MYSFYTQSFNPVSEPSDDWECKFDGSSDRDKGINLETDQQLHLSASCCEALSDADKDFSFPCGPSLSEEDDELTESKIAAFLDEKVPFVVVVILGCHVFFKRTWIQVLDVDIHRPIVFSCFPQI